MTRWNTQKKTAIRGIDRGDKKAKARNIYWAVFDGKTSNIAYAFAKADSFHYPCIYTTRDKANAMKLTGDTIGRVRISRVK